MSEKDQYKKRDFVPQTEEEYWEVINLLGGLMFSIGHSHDRDPGAMKGYVEVRDRLEELVSEASKKFNFVNPYDQSGETSPIEAISYQKWFNGMQEKIFSAEHDGILCSSCPNGKEYDGVSVPCEIFGGFLKHDPKSASRCQYVDYNRRMNVGAFPSSHFDLISELRRQHGDEAVRKMEEMLGDLIDYDRERSKFGFDQWIAWEPDLKHIFCQKTKFIGIEYDGEIFHCTSESGFSCGHCDDLDEACRIIVEVLNKVKGTKIPWVESDEDE